MNFRNMLLATNKTIMGSNKDQIFTHTHTHTHTQFFKCVLTRGSF